MGTSTDRNPTYQYTTPGVYDVTLTVYGLGGTASYTRSGYITVTTPILDVTLGTISPLGSATLAGLGSYAYNAVGTLLATPTGGGGIDYADIVFLIAQTDVMPTMAANVPALVTALEAELIANSIGAGANPNNYALVGFEDGTTSPVDKPTKKSVGGGDWGTAAQLNTAIGALTFPFTFASQNGDGYYACEFALSSYTFRAGAPKIFVIVTNEERNDITSGAVTYATSQSALTAANVILNVLVSVNIVDTNPADFVFARDALNSTTYIDIGSPPYYSATGVFSSWTPDRLDLKNSDVINSYCVWCGQLDGYEWAFDALGTYTGFINAFAALNAARVVAQVGASYTFNHFVLNGGSNITSNPYYFNVITDTVVDVYTV